MSLRTQKGVAVVGSSQATAYPQTARPQGRPFAPIRDDSVTGSAVRIRRVASPPGSRQLRGAVIASTAAPSSPRLNRSRADPPGLQSTVRSERPRPVPSPSRRVASTGIRLEGAVTGCCGADRRPSAGAFVANDAKGVMLPHESA